MTDEPGGVERRNLCVMQSFWGCDVLLRVL